MYTFSIIFRQAHVCRLSEDHVPGLECLSDGQILPILFAIDPDTLLSCRRANRRLRRLAFDKLVWRSLLKKIEYFPVLKGDPGQGEDKERLDKLVKFVVDTGSSEMKADLVKEVASRFLIHIGGYAGDNYYICSQKGEGFALSCLFKVTVSIQGWDDAADAFEMSEGHLHELHNLAQVVGAKFTVKEVKSIEHTPHQMGFFESLKLIAALVDQQGEGLDKLELNSVNYSYCLVYQDIFYSLVKGSKEWKFQNVFINNFLMGIPFIWEALARSAGTGHIGTIRFYPIFYEKDMQRAGKVDVKAVWEITEKMELLSKITNQVQIVIGGGRGEDPKTNWEEAYETLLKNICN